ncbi:hypothetical protein ACJJI5_10570 [Microbulbifer sp. EKSA008]|uniref:hypothetical protein n=1 Tax=unclassified Microbulbifer TaxID=2619833 RepID=UPI0040398F6C
MNVEKWEATREKGKARFIWGIGFCFWGLLTALMWSITMEIADPSAPIWLRPLIAFIGFPLGGLGVAYFMWETCEAK